MDIILHQVKFKDDFLEVVKIAVKKVCKELGITQNKNDIIASKKAFNETFYRFYGRKRCFVFK